MAILLNSFLLISFILLPNTAFANSFAPVLPIFSAAGWIGLPLIIILEGYLLKKAGVSKPFKISLIVNLVSSLVGLPIAALNFLTGIPGVALDSEIIHYMQSGKSPFTIVLLSFIFILLSLIFNYWLSYKVEYYAAKKFFRVERNPLHKRIFLRTNAYSYGLLFLCFLYIPFTQLRILTSPSFAATKFIEQKANLGKIDLRHFQNELWDEMAILKPYSDLCSLGIEGYDNKMKDCLTSTDDGETYIVFIKDNQLAYVAPYSRKKVDFATSDLPERIKRAQANFELTSEGSFSKVVIRSK